MSKSKLAIALLVLIASISLAGNAYQYHAAQKKLEYNKIRALSAMIEILDNMNQQITYDRESNQATGADIGNYDIFRRANSYAREMRNYSLEVIQHEPKKALIGNRDYAQTFLYQYQHFLMEIPSWQLIEQKDRVNILSAYEYFYEILTPIDRDASNYWSYMDRIGDMVAPNGSHSDAIEMINQLCFDYTLFEFSDYAQ